MLQKIGPIMLDLKGTELTQEEQEILQHPLVGGVILFTRNYESPEQLTILCDSIRKSRNKPVLIAADQEGGRVQRFKEGITRLPSMGLVGQIYNRNPNEGLLYATSAAWLMASEMIALGLDISFAPVLDLNKTINPVVGDRSFHKDPEHVIILAKAWINGMRQAGMATTGKHFPGHGAVNADSHSTLPIDNRDMHAIEQDDLKTFVELLSTHLDAIMPAHILFSLIDEKPVGFSSVWLQTILREKYRFSGMIFSDDLNMHGASFAGSYANRANTALQAGCDMALICNNRPAAINILDGLSKDYCVDQKRFAKMLAKKHITLPELKKNRQWQENYSITMKLNEN